MLRLIIVGLWVLNSVKQGKVNVRLDLVWFRGSCQTCNTSVTACILLGLFGIPLVTSLRPGAASVSSKELVHIFKSLTSIRALTELCAAIFVPHWLQELSSHQTSPSKVFPCPFIPPIPVCRFSSAHGHSGHQEPRDQQC